MDNKCPNCGNLCSEFDAFCPKCGYKLHDTKSSSDSDFDILKKAALNNANKYYEDNKNKRTFNSEFFNPSVSPKNESLAFNLALFFFIIVLILSLISYFSIENHKLKKEELNFKNLINNPSQIPELKEPVDDVDLTRNFSSVTNFLRLYLKFSDDSIEKKQQVFISYLNEAEKLPHLTNESLIRDDFNVCYSIDSKRRADLCCEKFSRDFKTFGITAFSDKDTVYLYPNYKFINKTFSRYFSKDMKNYLELRAKYNAPASIGLDLLIKPKELAKRISEFEKMYLTTSDPFVKDACERILFDDFRKFIFTPMIYDTTTQEMAPEFRRAYEYFISSNKDSALKPVIMSYLDKKRSYNEENFNNDYPYTIFEETYAETIQNSVFKDVFTQLRKNAFSDNSKTEFSYIYNSDSTQWQNYDPNLTLVKGQFVISEPDENKNISIYNNTLSLVQEINISRYSYLFFYKNALYIFNPDRLSISKIIYNGRQFSVDDYSFSDVTSLFPGITVINIDSYSNYSIFVEKDNQQANYIILAKYSSGFNQYSLSPIYGSYTGSSLPNMFSVNSTSDVVLSYHGKNIAPEETSESVPTYKITIHTRGHETAQIPQKEEFAPYDEQTAIDEQNSSHEPNMMPKINREDDALIAPPQQKIDPPAEE